MGINIADFCLPTTLQIFFPDDGCLFISNIDEGPKYFSHEIHTIASLRGVSVLQWYAVGITITEFSFCTSMCFFSMKLSVYLKLPCNDKLLASEILNIPPYAEIPGCRCVVVIKSADICLSTHPLHNLFSMTGVFLFQMSAEEFFHRTFTLSLPNVVYQCYGGAPVGIKLTEFCVCTVQYFDVFFLMMLSFYFRLRWSRIFFTVYFDYPFLTPSFGVAGVCGGNKNR